jgi:hypothetical protein
MSHKYISTRARDLLAEVLAAGGCLDVDQWRALARQHGYRRSNGFFGSPWPSMRSDRRLRFLTERGRQRAAR